jgi:parallel beta-helix repeat protein
MEIRNIKKYLISIYLIISLSTLGTFTFLFIDNVFDSPTVSAAPIIVDKGGDGDFSYIQVAIDNAKPGDTIRIWAGVYNENILINEKIKLIGNGSTVTRINGNSLGDTIRVTANGTVICGLNVTNSNYGNMDDYGGIHLKEVEDIIIKNCTFYNNDHGIFLESSDYVQVTNNTFISNRRNGVLGYSSYFNNISNNSCFNHKLCGILFVDSEYNFIYNNSCMQNKYGIRIRNSNSNRCEKNRCEFNSWGGIISFSDSSFNNKNNIILNNICNNNTYHGIYLQNGGMNVISNNEAGYSKKYTGIYVYSSHSNKIENNLISSNNRSQIYISNSESNIIVNNTCNRSITPIIDGISLDNCKSNIIKNNTLLTCCIIPWGDKLENWNTHTIDESNKYDGRPIYYWCNRTNGIPPKDAGQIILANCSNVTIEGLDINYSLLPIHIGFSSGNIIKNNNLSECCISIYLQNSKNNLISNNSCTSNEYSGIYLIKSDGNRIENNNCSNIGSNDEEGFGIFLDSSNQNTILNNTCNSNNHAGILLTQASDNLIINNNVTNNLYNGISLNRSSNKNTISLNYISKNNKSGLLLDCCSNTKIFHNHFIENPTQATVIGSNSLNSWDNYFREGNFWSDYQGLDNGANGRIADDGIGDTDVPHNGLDYYPFIKPIGWLYPASPILYDIVMDYDDYDSDGKYTLYWYCCRPAERYIIEEDTSEEFNSPKVVFNGSESYCNILTKSHGTYYYRIKGYSNSFTSNWSNIKFITVDLPPQVPKNLTVTPLLEGNALNISWSLNMIDTAEYDLYYKKSSEQIWRRKRIFQQSDNSYIHSNLIDGIEYEYKLCARDSRGQVSNFCGIVSGTPKDTIPPNIPNGLKIEYTTYNSILLSWERNNESDLKGYNIYRANLSNLQSWGDLIGNVTKDYKQYLDENVEELRTYYYVITAFDEVPNESNFSTVVLGKTKLGPHGPIVNNSIPDFEIYEDSIDSVSINLYFWFSDINHDKLTFQCFGNNHLDIQINKKDGSVIIIPEKDWSGNETLTFYCSDGTFNVTDQIYITVLPLNDPPDTPIIISPIYGFKITNSEQLDFVAQCSDPDLPYGDNLTFVWTSNLIGEFGRSSNLTNVLLPPGEHIITLEVFDDTGNSSYTTIVITIMGDNSVKENSSSFQNLILGIVLIIIILVITFIILIRNRSSSEAVKISEDLNSSPEYISNLPTKMIGRDSEMNMLESYLNNVKENNGKTIFISGEPGIGKTRLLNEIKLVTKNNGFQILSSNCTYESLTPFQPFLDALKSGGLEYLFPKEAPKVEAVYLISNSGLLIQKVIRKKSHLNPYIFASVLTSVSNFVKESISLMDGAQKEETMNILGFENYRYLIESGPNINLVLLISGKENEFLINDMKNVFKKLDKKYGEIFHSWDGDEKSVAGTKNIIQPFISSGKYDGVYFEKTKPKVKRNLLFKNITLGLIRQAKTKPILICLEDLQWSDQSSLALLSYISKHTNKSKVMIIGTYRPEEVSLEESKGYPLIEIMQSLENENWFIKMELTRLEQRYLKDFLISMLGQIDFTTEFINQIYSETEGNPLFIIQLINFFIVEKIIENVNGIWKLMKPPEEYTIIPKIYNLILNRLKRLDADQQRILEFASVIGEVFSSQLLASALDVKKVELLEQLRELELKYRLICAINGNYRFDHGKIKEVVYEEIPVELRLEYHKIIGNAIEDLNKNNIDSVVGDLAFHFYKCRDKEKALFYLESAANKAENDYLHKEAIKFYTLAMELIEDENKISEIREKMSIIEKSGQIPGEV